MRFPVPALLLAFTACSGVSLEPATPVILEIDRTSYDALPVSESIAGTPNLRFRLIARLVNRSDEPVSFDRCGAATTPVYGVSLARPAGSVRSGYDPAWACMGSTPLTLAANSSRTDTLSIFGPTGRNGYTQDGYGELEGSFVLQYGTSRGTISSPEFLVRRAALTGTRVTLLNDGAVAFTNVRVITSVKDSIPLLASLTPGGRAGPYPVGSLHSAPLVSLLAQGRSVISQPIEGFSGFNPPLSEGAYVVRVRLTLDGTLDVRVQPDGE